MSESNESSAEVGTSTGPRELEPGRQASDPLQEHPDPHSETRRDFQMESEDPEQPSVPENERQKMKQGILQAVAKHLRGKRGDGATGAGDRARAAAGAAAALFGGGSRTSQAEREGPVRRIAPVMVDFQPDAVELEVAPIPGRLRWVLYTVTLFLLTVVAWAYWTKIETFVVAQGRLVPISEPIMIQAAAGSPVRQIHVRFGDIVNSGDLLATLDATIPTADFESLRGRIQTAEARLARLQAEQAQARNFDLGTRANDPIWLAEAAFFRSRLLAYQSQMEEISADLDSLDAKIRGNEDEIAGLEEALVIHRQVEDRMERLSIQKAQSENAYLNQKLNRQEVELKINNLKNQILQLAHDRQAAVKRQQRVTADREAEVSGQIVETNNELHVLKSDLEKATRMIELSELRVPDDLPYTQFYVLEASERTSGSVVRETDPLFKLMPLKDPLRIEAEIVGRDIGEVRIDDSAIIKLDALPYQKHGTLKGRLSTISEGAFEKKEGMAEYTYFKAYVTIEDRAIHNKPVNFRPVPGMTCKVELRVGKRRVIDYFLYPLFRHLDESLREPSQRGTESASGSGQLSSL